MNTHHTAGAARQFAAFLLILVSVLIAGCDGSDGADGAPGLPASVDIANATAINAVINSAAASSGSPVITTFTLTDDNGNPVKNLPASAISFNLAKLVPGTDGNPSAWQSYINVIEQPGVGPGTEEQLQAATENGNTGTLTDNQDGTYTYKFSFNIDSVIDPVNVEFVETLTHRITFEIRGYVPVSNPVYDWRPQDNATGDLFTREIAKTETCNVCHENLALHGGARFKLQGCVACHNPGSADANSGNTVDMVVMTHKIHHGVNLPSVAFADTAGARYSIYGFGDREHIYSLLVNPSDNPDTTPGDTEGVVHPQDIRNCSNCHNDKDPQTPDAANWYTNPYDAACGSCHDNVDFATGKNHAGIVANNTQCATCHTRIQDPPSRLEVRQAHRILTAEQAENYRHDILNITFAPPSGGPSTPTVRFAISNPQMGGPDDQNARYDLENNAELQSSSITLRLAWSTVDYSNTGSDTNNAQPQNAGVFSSGMLQATPNGDLTYNLDLGAVPEGTTGSGVIVLEGGVNTEDGRAPVTTAYRYFSITDDAADPVPRRTAVDIARCNDCHEITTAHNNGRNNAIENCQVCHVANAARSRGGPMDMKHYIHRKHAVDDIRYPQRTSNCLACHTNDGFYPVSSDSGVQASSVNRGTDAAIPENNNRISANAAACGVCHDSADAQAHMTQNGASFDACQETDGTLHERINVCGPGGDKTGALVLESCSVCHGVGRSIDTARVHKLTL